MSAPLNQSCPHCPGSSRVFSAHGLRIHIGHMHKGIINHPVPTSLNSSSVSDSPAVSQVASAPPRCLLERLPALKVSTPVLRHVPRGARNQAAGKLCDIIDRCIACNGEEDWSALLTFAYVALKVPPRDAPGNVTAKVKANIMSDPNRSMDESSNISGQHKSRGIRRAIESKVFEGDLRGAVRLLVSEDSFAQFDPGTLHALGLKHPSPSRPLNFPPAPDTSYTPVTVSAEDVSMALTSFYSGSAAGLDGIRPGHLKELTSGAAGENGLRLLESLAKISNFLLSGQVNPAVCPFLYGASLCALSKKGGGLRPIAVGSVFRRLVAKLACWSVREVMAKYLQPHQLGFGTRRGCEAAIHATRAFVMDPKHSDCIVLKLDISNAFNSLERDVLLAEVKDKIPALYPFLYQIYASPSNLFYNKSLILSQVGAQQGDPLGPLIFSLAIHKVILELRSSLNLWYLDDGTLGGSVEDVYQDLEMVIPRLRELGLELNPNKCEFYPCSAGADVHFQRFTPLLPGLMEVSRESFSLLGSPIFLDGVPEAISSRKRLLLAARERLGDLSAHVALVLFRMCFALPKMTYLLRTAPTWLCPEDVSSFDEVLRATVESILNVSLDDTKWNQAALPVRYGGLGVRCTRDVGLPAFLASAHGVADLVTVILHSDGGEASIPFTSDALLAWSVLSGGVSGPLVPYFQRAWDDITSKQNKEKLLEGAIGADLARLRAVSQPESGAWLHALPSPHLGTLLDGDSLRVAVALRLGCKVCEPHMCTCGSRVEADGHHALSCRRCTGRFSRHHALNDIVRRAFISVNVPCVLEPPGLSRSDGKRPDGMTLVPWKNGRCLVWDATCVSTVAPSHLSRSILAPAAAAEDAARNKRLKYCMLESSYDFVPFAVETLGSWGTEARSLVSELGRRLRDKSGDSRAGSYLVQRLAMAIQRGNAASIMGTFAPGTVRGGLF